MLSWGACWSLVGCSGLIKDSSPPDAPPDAVSDGNTSPDPGAPPGNASGSDTPLPVGADRCEGVTFDPGAALVRRLASWEYGNAVASTLGLDLREQIQAAWPPSARLGGFSNAAEAQVATLAHIEAFEGLADLVADAADAAALVQSCRSATSCPAELAERLGPSLFRRSLSTSELGRLSGIMSSAPTPEDGARWMIRVLLQSGSFLYRVEDAPAGTQLQPVPPEALAIRLAYLAWGDGPDEALLAAARRGELATDDQLRAQIQRLLADPRAVEQSVRLIEDWLGVANVGRSNIASLDGVDEALLADMKAETLAFTRHVLWTTGQPVGALFTARSSVVSARLADWYGLESMPDADGTYVLNNGRRGLLTQAAVLAQAAGADASMIGRGLYILDNVLCQGVPSPPDSLDRTEIDTGDINTLRDEAEARLARAACYACHGAFEPLAFAFERFDGAGRYSDQNDDGFALRSEGQITLQNGETFSWQRVEDFAPALVATAAAQNCLIQKPLSFALGRPVEETGSDACATQEIREAFAAGGETYPALVEAIALHPIFRMMRPSESGD